MNQQPTLRSSALELYSAALNPAKNKVSDGNLLSGSVRNSEIIRAFAGIAPAGPHAPEFNRALASVDFQNLTGDMITTSLNQPMKYVPTHEPFSDVRILPDFKPASLYEVGPLALLLKEAGGEYKNAELSGAHVIGRVETYARKILMTRDSYVNGDIVIIDRMVQNLRREAKRLEDELIYSAMENNAVGPDGEAFFSSAHANVLTSPSVDVASLTEAAELLADQKDIDGRRMGTVATTLISSSLNQFLTEETFARMPGSTLTRVYSPLIQSGAWYLTGDTPFCSILHYAGSNGAVEIKASTDQLPLSRSL